MIGVGSRTRWAGAAGLVLAGVTLIRTGAAELVQRPQSNITLEGAIDPAPVPARQPAAPDERPLWRLLSAGEDQALALRLTELAASYPGWTPPPRMRELLDTRADERRFARAKAQGDWVAMRRIAASRPGFAACARPDDAAAVTAAPGASPGLGSALATCADEAGRLALLRATLDRFGPAAVTPYLSSIVADRLPAADQAGFAAFRTDLGLRGLEADLAAGAPRVLARAAEWRDTIAARKDAGLADALGWAALKQDRPRDALQWFQAARRADPARPASGLIRAALALGDLGLARHVAADTHPSPALEAEIEAAVLNAAFRRGAFAEVASSAAQLADPPVLLGWSLFRLARFGPASRAFERHYAAHHDQASADGLLLSLVQDGRLDEAEAAATRLGGPAAAALAVSDAPGGTDLGYRLALTRLRAAVARQDTAAADRIAALLAPAADARHDTAAKTALGWAALQAGRLDAAARWFAAGLAAGDDDAAFGAALVRFRAGDPGLPASLASQVDGRSAPRWRTLRADALMQRAAADPSIATQAAQDVLRLDPDRRDARLLIAWDDYHRGEADRAAAAFEALYRAHPDPDSAIGLALTAPPARLDAITAAMPGPLAVTVAGQSARQALDRKDFRAAAQWDPAALPALVNLATPSIGVEQTVRSKSGTSGTSRLQSEATDVVGTLPRGADAFTLRLHLVHLDAGSPGPGLAGQTRTLPLGAEPSVSWQREPMRAPLLSPSVELGTTPIGGMLAPTVTGRAGLAYQAGFGSVRLDAYRQAVTESVLSFTGIRDAAGHRFGRVTETGVRVEAGTQVLPGLGLYGQVGGGVRDGVGVRANGHVQAAVTLAHDFRPPGFDALTLGPSYQFSHFDRNLSGFTPGQGGYYSPSGAHVVGAALRLLTRESQQFAVRASAFAGYQLARSTVPGGGRPGDAGRQDGLNATGDVTAAYRLADHWIAGAMVRYQVSPQYNDLYAGLALTFSFGARAALLSADLPRFDLR